MFFLIILLVLIVLSIIDYFILKYLIRCNALLCLIIIFIRAFFNRGGK